MRNAWSRLYQWCLKLPIAQIYAVVAALLLTGWLLCIIAKCMSTWAWNNRRVVGRSVSSHVPNSWNHVRYFTLPRLFQCIDICTRAQALGIAVLMSANLVALLIETPSWTTTQQRAGSLAVIHLIPLCTGVNFGFPADLLHLDRSVMAWFHRWVGRICVFHAVLHSVLVLSTSKNINIANMHNMIPVLVRSHRQANPF